MKVQISISAKAKSTVDPNLLALDTKLKLLPEQQVRVSSKATNLQKYLGGRKVSDAWVKAFVKRRSPEQPEMLYRLCLIGRASELGKTVTVRKPLVSASDKKLSAVIGGCSYHVMSKTNMKGKHLVLVEIENPTTLMSFNELKNIIRKDNSLPSQYSALMSEREHLIKGPMKGTVIQLIDTDLVVNRRITRIVAKTQRGYTPAVERSLLKKINAGSLKL